MEKICSIIEKWGLTKWDADDVTGNGTDSVVDTGTVSSYPEKLTSGWYRVRNAWTDGKTQIGAYKVLANAKAKADANAGYYVFDNNGRMVYTGKKTVAVSGKKTNEQVADEIIKGLWGNGEDRKQRLAKAGYDYTAVQGIVNKKLGK